MVWTCRTLAASRKLQLFDACILSKLRYEISSAWLLKSDRRRLDGFQARCLRTILGILPSYVSRISNARVRQLAGQEIFSDTLQRLQLKLLDDVLHSPDRAAPRDVAFVPGTETPRTATLVRKVGSPMQNWPEQLLALRRRR